MKDNSYEAAATASKELGLSGEHTVHGGKKDDKEVLPALTLWHDTGKNWPW